MLGSNFEDNFISLNFIVYTKIFVYYESIKLLISSIIFFTL